MTNQLRKVVADALPELPTPAKTVRVDKWAVSHYYTANQMREYARAALATLPTQSAGVEERARALEWVKQAAIGVQVETDEHVETIAAALRTPASEGDGGRVVACCACGKPVDTRENDTPGSELTDGRWVCSGDCWDLATSPLATTPPTQQEAREADDVLAVAVDIHAYALDEANCWDAERQKWIVYRSTLREWAQRLVPALQAGSPT